MSNCPLPRGTIIIKIRPSDRKEIIRLKFLEKPYRLYFKIPKGWRVGFWSAAWAAVIPYVMYKGILKAVQYENQAKIKATFENDELKMGEMLENIRLK